MARNKESNRYSRLIEAIFSKLFYEGMDEIVFEREEIVKAALVLFKLSRIL